MSANDRSMHLLDGRRVQVVDLIEAQLVKVGEVLEFVRSRAGDSYTSTITAEGRLRLEDGREFAAPSRAAMEAAELPAVDGWSAWTVSRTGTGLSDLRQQLLVGAKESSDEGGAKTSGGAGSRHEMLTAARDSADTGTPVQVTVRELIALWGAKGRGQKIIDRVSADLDNHSLMTRPDFRKVTLDSPVDIVTQPIVTEEREEAKHTSAPEADGLDVGLTLGNVPSALEGLTHVNPNDSLQKAMTLMRLNDFSQLAVMATPRNVRGAVTWRSVAKALAHDSSARLADAVEPARLHSFDEDLVDVLAGLYDSDFVFVRNARNEVSGIVTTADVVLLYGDTATPFFIIGEIDHLLRSFISDEWTVEQVVQVCDPDRSRSIDSHNDLTFGDYQRMLEGAERFAALGWPLDRTTFIKRLNEIREIRNGVAHFDPDPLDAAAVSALRNFLYLLRDLRTRDLR